MEAENSHDLLSASWRPRKVEGIIQSVSEGPRIEVQISKGRRRWREASAPARRAGLPFCLFLLRRPFIDWTTPTCITEDDILS